MTVRSIRLFGDPVLKTPCCDAVTGDLRLEALVEDLLDTVRLEGRAGVAANQIGVSLRAFSYNINGDVGYVINPKLASVSGQPVATGEGCLSVPGLWFEVLRYPFARVEGVNLAGETVILEGEGLLAQALQHECDHLDGLLYLDKLDREQRKQALKQVRESAWF